MQLPPGFKVTLVASEPDIEQALNKYYGGEKKAMAEGAFKDVIQELTQGWTFR